ncbi:MAG: hypothetical protein IJ079_00670 [Lachnospiraceae bacterium]|nr:hypothetical protein [Lachnospiraceae bacterium]
MEELSNIDYSLSKEEFVVLAALREMDRFYGIEMDVNSYDDITILNALQKLAAKGIIENQDRSFKLASPYDSMFDYLKYSDLFLSITAFNDEIVPSYVYVGRQLLLIKNDAVNSNRLLMRLMSVDQLLTYLDDMDYLNFDRYSEKAIIHFDCKRISTAQTVWELHIDRDNLDYYIYGKKDGVTVEREYQKDEFMSMVKKWL